MRRRARFPDRRRLAFVGPKKLSSISKLGVRRDVTDEVLWSWREACAAVGAPPVDGPAIRGVAIDSRTLERGDLFVALAGDPGPRFNTHSRSNRDGHDFAADAAARGAAGALVARPLDLPLPQIRVADTLDGLWALGAAARRRSNGAFFAITGSSGKTTVKTFLAAALDCAASQGSLNNFWGVPLSLARTPVSSRAAVLEIGTNHPGEIAPLAQLVRPHVAVVLNVYPAHVEYFGTLEALRGEKLSIATGLVDGGTLVAPDDLDLPGVNASRVITFGSTAAADVRLVSLDAARLHARYAMGTRTVEAAVPGGGQHRALSLAAVIGCLLAVGENPSRAAALDPALVPRGRGARRDVNGIVVIDDSYNANPVSMRAALEELAREDGGRRYALLGEMRELGADAPRLHRELADACTALDGVFCVGQGMRTLLDALPPSVRMGYADEATTVSMATLLDALEPGDRLLVKGSNRVFWVHDFVEKLVAELETRRAKKAAR
jgi:UDP-N-acetylmuramoyl-tripeptide--D-alanyl-D-alanine ligase